MEELGGVIEVAREARGLIKLGWPVVRYAMPSRRRRYTGEGHEGCEAWGRYQALVLRK